VKRAKFRCEKSTTSNCWSDRATGLRTHASQRPRGRVAKPQATLHAMPRPRTCTGRVPARNALTPFWAFFSPFLPFAHRLPGSPASRLYPGGRMCAQAGCSLAITAEAGPRHLTGRVRSNSCRPAYAKCVPVDALQGLFNRPADDWPFGASIFEPRLSA